jgi:flagellar hook protein FlgE
MNVNSVLDSGLTGVRQGIEGVEKAASEIVRAGTVDGADGANDVIEPIIDLRLYQRSVEASAQVVRTADEVLGTLLDTMA